MFDIHMKNPVVFLAPGSGLGHLVRVASICIELKEKNIDSVIISTSRWTRAISGITNTPAIEIPGRNWADALRGYLHKLAPKLVVQDTFPFGFKGESLEYMANKIPFIYLARCLNVARYLEKMNIHWDTSSKRLANVIVIEPLNQSHIDLIFKSSNNIFKLHGRIRLPLAKINTPIPEKLKRKIRSHHLHLVVHSGPFHETDRLIAMAQKNIQKENRGELAIINPFFARSNKEDAVDYFPAAVLFPDAYRIYTGCGYNSIAEGEIFPRKQQLIPFLRNYDDQFFRQNTQNPYSVSGTIQVVKIIEFFL